VVSLALLAEESPDASLQPGQVRVHNTLVVAPVAIADQRYQNIDSLIVALRQKKDHERQVQICYALGELRAEQAIDDLIPHLPLRVEPTVNKRLPRWGEFPVREALAKIGHPAAQKLLVRLGGETAEEFRQAAVDVILMVYTPALARSAIEQQAASEANPLRKERLLACLPLLEAQVSARQ